MLFTQHDHRACELK